MPNRNWKEHFLGKDFKSGSFRLGVSILVSVDGDKYR